MNGSRFNGQELRQRWWQAYCHDLQQQSQRPLDMDWLDVKPLAIMVAVMLALVALLYLIGGYHTAFLTVNSMTPWFNPVVLEVMTYCGDTAVVLVLALLLGGRNARLHWAILLVAIISIAYTHGLKESVQALRPPAVFSIDQFNLIGHSIKRVSFPSGHTVTAFVFATVLYYFVSHKLLRALLMISACFIGLSRVWVGVHWPIDVLCGAAGGIVCSTLAVWLAGRGQMAFNPKLNFFILSILVIAALYLPFHDGGYDRAQPYGWWLSLLALLATAWRYAPMLRQPMLRQPLPGS